MHDYQPRSENCRHLSCLGSRHNLTFPYQEILKDAIMGLDGAKKKLLIVSDIKSRPHHYVIDLNEVSSYSVKKYYGRINVNGLKNRELDQYLEQIVLRSYRSYFDGDFVFLFPYH